MKFRRIVRKTFKIVSILLLVLVLVFIGLMWWGSSAMSTSTEETIRKINLPAWADYQSEILDLGSRKIHWVCEKGDLDSPLLLFVHGSPGAYDNFLPYFQDSLLYRSFRLASFDRPGYGDMLNSRVEPSLSQQAELLAKLITHSNAVEVILIGHSYGCSVIAELTSLYPLLADRVVMIAPPVDPAFEKGLFLRKIGNLPPFRWLMPGPFRVSNRELTSLKAGLVDLAPRIQEIRTPTLVFQGSEDRLVPAGNADYMKRKYKDGIVQVHMLEGRNHFILWSETELISKSLRNLAPN